MIAAVGDRGLLRFVLREGALDADRCLLAFLRRLIKDAGRQVLPIVDSLKARHAGKVKAWVASHAPEIGLFHPPAHTPGHRPDEHLDRDLKQRLRRKPQPAAKEDLIRSARSGLRAVPRSPERVRACSTPEPVRYAA